MNKKELGTNVFTMLIVSAMLLSLVSCASKSIEKPNVHMPDVLSGM